MNDISLITVAEPISPLWKIVDNQAVSWINRRVDWLFSWGSAAATLVGYMTSPQGVFLIAAQKAISTALFTFSNYGNVHRVQSTFRMHEIRALMDNVNAAPFEKYCLADLLYQRALQYDFGAGIFVTSPGHYKENVDFITQSFRYYLNSEIVSYLILQAIYGDNLSIQSPEFAIIHDIQAAKALYKEVMDSEDPQMTEALKADAIYKYTFLFVHGSFHKKNEPISGDAVKVVVDEYWRRFNGLTEKGRYAEQMDRLSTIKDLSPLIGMSWHHPREALESMENFGITINRFRDICKTCSMNMGVKSKFASF